MKTQEHGSQSSRKLKMTPVKEQKTGAILTPVPFSKIAWHTGYIICRNHLIIFEIFVSQ